MTPPSNQSDETLPSSVSSQNGEEAEPGHDGPQDSSGGHASDDAPDTGQGEGAGGKSSEGSQSTGNPNSAG